MVIRTVYKVNIGDKMSCTILNRGRRGHDRMVVRFTTTYAIGAYIVSPLRL
jgi:hypothetical protein